MDGVPTRAVPSRRDAVTSPHYLVRRVADRTSVYMGLSIARPGGGGGRFFFTRLGTRGVQ